MEVKKVNITNLVEHEKEVLEHSSLHDKDQAHAVVDDGGQIKNAIVVFKSEILSLFNNHEHIECLKMVPAEGNHFELTLFKDQLQYNQHQSDGSNRLLIIDFKSNTLRTDTSIIKNVKILEKLFLTIEKIVKGLANNTVHLYEK